MTGGRRKGEGNTYKGERERGKGEKEGPRKGETEKGSGMKVCQREIKKGRTKRKG